MYQTLTKCGCAFILVPAMLGLSGCGQGWAGKETEQGKELESILREQRKIVIATPAGLPIQFDAIEIERRAESGDTSCRAVVIWRLKDDPAIACDLLRTMVVSKYPEHAERELKSVKIRLQYKDKNGKECGGDDIELEVAQKDGKAILQELGKVGTPHSATATLESFTLREKEVTVSAK